MVQELEAGDAMLEIPWSSGQLPNLQYIDLKQNPEKIETLQECCRHPPLARLLRAANAAGSPFRTAKCDVWTTTRLAEDERLDFRLPFKVGSYIDILFDSAQLNSRLESYRCLGESLERALSFCWAQAQAELAIRRCLFHPKERWGFYATLFFHAYGATRAEAKREWGRAAECLGAALVKVRPSFAGARKRRSSR